MERSLLNTTRPITISIFSLLLIFITMLYTLNVSATEEDLEVRIEHKEQELSGVRTRIEILERYLKFEKGWEKKLKAAIICEEEIADDNERIARVPGYILLYKIPNHLRML